MKLLMNLKAPRSSSHYSVMNVLYKDMNCIYEISLLQLNI